MYPYISMFVSVCFYARNIFHVHIRIFLCLYVSMLEHILCLCPYVSILGCLVADVRAGCRLASSCHPGISLPLPRRILNSPASGRGFYIFMIIMDGTHPIFTLMMTLKNSQFLSCASFNFSHDSLTRWRPVSSDV